MYNIVKAATSGPALFIAVGLLTTLRSAEEAEAIKDAILMSPWKLNLCSFGHCDESHHPTDPLIFFSLTLTLVGWADKIFTRYLTLMSIKMNFLAISSHICCCFPTQLCLRINVLTICPTVICMNPAAFDICISMFHLSPCLLSVSPHLFCYHYSLWTYHPCLWSIKKWSDVFPDKVAKMFEAEPPGYDYLDGDAEAGSRRNMCRTLMLEENENKEL